jgi:hypothetical protein
VVTLLNNVNPYMRIFDEASESFVAFQGGKLEIEPGDPGYEAVMRVVEATPSIIVQVGGKQCLYCGETFAGKVAAANLTKHVKDVHFEIWQARQDAEHGQAIEKELRRRVPFACEVCPTVQEFGSAEDLALHTTLVHTTPTVDSDGNAVGEGPGGESSGRKGRNAAADAPAEPSAAK